MGKRRFQQRFIAFVDVLGFGSIVKRMSGDDRLSSEVFQSIVSGCPKLRAFLKIETRSKNQLRARGTL